MNLDRSCPIHIGEGAAVGSIRASIELTLAEWEEITRDLRGDGLFDTTSDEPELPLRERIELLFECALAEWEQTNARPGIDPMDDPDDPWPF